MSIVYNGDKIQVDASITKITTFSAKGGGINATVELPDDPQIAAALVKNRGNIARITIEFSSSKAKLSKEEAEEQGQGCLALDDLDGALE